MTNDNCHTVSDHMSFIIRHTLPQLMFSRAFSRKKKYTLSP